MAKSEDTKSGGLRTVQISIAIVLGLMVIATVAIAAINNVNGVPENAKAIKENTDCLATIKPKVETVIKDIIRIDSQGTQGLRVVEKNQIELQTQMRSIQTMQSEGNSMLRELLLRKDQ